MRPRVVLALVRRLGVWLRLAAVSRRALAVVWLAQASRSLLEVQVRIWRPAQPEPASRSQFAEPLAPAKASVSKRQGDARRRRCRLGLELVSVALRELVYRMW